MLISIEEEDTRPVSEDEDTDSPCPFCNDKGGHDCFACYYDNYSPL